MTLQQKIDLALNLSLLSLGITIANCFIMAVGLWVVGRRR